MFGRRMSAEEKMSWDISQARTEYGRMKIIAPIIAEEESRNAALALGVDISNGVLPEEDFTYKAMWKVHYASTRVVGSTSSPDGRGERFITAGGGESWVFMFDAPRDLVGFLRQHHSHHPLVVEHCPSIT